MSAAPECREWEYRDSTDSIEYTVSHFEYRFEFRPDPDRPVKRCSGGFMVVHIAEKGYLKVTCLVEGQEEDDHHHYLQSQQDNFTAELRSQYPDVSGTDAAKVTTTFTDILQLANAGHRCPAAGGGFFGTLHIIYFKIQPLLRLAAPATAATELVVIPNNDWCGDDDDDDDDEEEEEEEGWPKSQPATRASIMELLKAASSSSSSGDGGECGICMEEIEPLPWLRMPCLHSFHRLCLLQWLNNSHSCPLCRYQMPAVQFKLSDHRPNA